MTNSELYRELYNLKEKNKDKFENISIEQFLYNIGYYLETKYYDNYMNNENFLNLVKDSTFVYPKSGEQLTLSIKNSTIYFKGAVKKVFVTSI